MERLRNPKRGDTDAGFVGGIRQATCVVVTDVQRQIRADREFNGIETRRFGLREAL
jgi:hypothetical protein